MRLKTDVTVQVMISVRVTSTIEMSEAEVAEAVSETHFDVGRIARGIHASIAERQVLALEPA